MRIAYYPRQSGANIYSSIVMDALRLIPAEVRAVSPKRLFDMLWLIFRHPNVAIVNWIENFCINRKGNISVIGVVIATMLFLFLKVSCKKLIFVKHNLAPHGATGKARKASQGLISFFEKWSDLVVVHSPVYSGTSQMRLLYVPHPAYPVWEKFEHYPDVGFLFFGSIARHKLLGELVEAWPPLLKLTIAGVCHDVEFLKELNLVATDKNVTIMADYIDDETASSLVRSATAIVVPNTGGDALVSGSFIYAISHRCAVISVSSPYTKYFAEKINDARVVIVEAPRDIADVAKSWRCGQESHSKLVDEEFSGESVRGGWINALKFVSLGGPLP